MHDVIVETACGNIVNAARNRDLKMRDVQVKSQVFRGVYIS